LHWSSLDVANSTDEDPQIKINVWTSQLKLIHWAT